MSILEQKCIGYIKALSMTHDLDFQKLKKALIAQRELCSASGCCYGKTKSVFWITVCSHTVQQYQAQVLRICISKMLFTDAEIFIG